MKCPKCGSATWTDKIKRPDIGPGFETTFHKCFCGWCSRPDLMRQQFMTKVVKK